VNPYPGLRPFEDTDEDVTVFFGRDSQVDELLARLQHERFVGIVGQSGCGKSSLVRAGLLPALHAGFIAGAGSHWRIAIMRPGSRPIETLARALEHSGALHRVSDDEPLRIGLTQAVLDGGALGLVEGASIPQRTYSSSSINSKNCSVTNTP
jgi:energy-coupling factor transporter ATP-binding protein EcfA2